MQHKTGFVIDIDGTLTHVGKGIPEATLALDHLSETKTPFVLLTNNCAPSEEWKAKQLTELLHLKHPLDPEQIILNYSPVKDRFK